LKLKVGAVLRWDNFPLQKFGGTNKARWFICLGFSGVFAQVAFVYLGTTTTQLQYFRGHGQRSTHSHFIFETKQFPVFDQDCATDYDERPYAVNKTKIELHSKDISIRGELKEEIMRMIYNRFLRSRPLPRVELLDIHTSYNIAGITGLKKP